MKGLAYLFIIFSLLLFIFGGYQLWLRYDPYRLSFQDYKPSTTATPNQKELPVRIILKDQKIDLPIFPAKVTGHVWETTQNGASYLVSSPIPGTEGNSIIYAHNWASLFGRLPNSKPGQEVVIIFADGSKKVFKITSTAVVTAMDASILAPSKDKHITLYTCTDWFDRNRFVLTAVLVK